MSKQPAKEFYINAKRSIQGDFEKAGFGDMYQRIVGSVGEDKADEFILNLPVCTCQEKRQNGDLRIHTSPFHLSVAMELMGSSAPPAKLRG